MPLRRVEHLAFACGQWMVVLECGHHLRARSLERAVSLKGRTRLCKRCEEN